MKRECKAMASVYVDHPGFESRQLFYEERSMERKINTVFKRVEVKYRIPEDKIRAFRDAIRPYMQLDAYGLTTIMNIYYDTDGNLLISRSLDKPKYKEKLRLRTYGIPDAGSTSFVELKKKVGGIVYKRREVMPLREAEMFLNNGIRPEHTSQITREIDWFRRQYHPLPKMFIAYDREAYYGLLDENFRLTLDKNIRYREDRLSLRYGDSGELLDPDGGYLLEIKVNGAMPLFMVRILTELKIYPVSFSKYGMIYSKINHREEETYFARECLRA